MAQYKIQIYNDYNTEEVIYSKIVTVEKRLFAFNIAYEWCLEIEKREGWFATYTVDIIE